MASNIVYCDAVDVVSGEGDSLLRLCGEGVFGKAVSYLTERDTVNSEDDAMERYAYRHGLKFN